MLAVNPVTASGGGRIVIIGFEVVCGPFPNSLEGVSVNVYVVPGVKPVNVRDVPLVVKVLVGGEDTIEYRVALRSGFHARSTVFIVGLLAVNPVTA